MEILTATQPEQELARWLNTTLGQALCGLSADRLPTAFANSQTNDLVHRVVNQTQSRIHPDNLVEILPDLNAQEIAHVGAKKIIEPLKVRQDSNKFGGLWNEWTAQVAATKLGLPHSRLAHQIAASGPVGQKLRQEQAAVARQTEELLRRQLATAAPENIVFAVKLETWIRRQIQELRQDLEQLAPTLGKQAKGEVVSDTVAALLEVLDFTSGQNQPTKLIRDRLLAARLGQRLNLVDLHCLSFRNSPEDGIQVATTASDFIVKDSQGNLVKVSQNDLLDGVVRFAEILDQHKISHRVIVLVTDNDRFVLPDQSERVNQFVASLEHWLQRHPLAHHNLEIVRASSVTQPDEFLPEWLRRSGQGDKLAEKEVEAVFTKLQQRTLPPQMKTRQFAREIAGKSFTLQASLGKHVPEVFHPAFVLQSSRAHQQAAEIFLLGNKQCPKPAVIISHWKGRQVLQ